VQKVSVVVKRLYFRRGSLCREALHRLQAVQICRQQLHFSEFVLHRRLLRSMLYFFLQTWLLFKKRCILARMGAGILRAWCRQKMYLNTYLKAWHHMPRPCAFLRQLARKAVMRWAQWHVLRLGFYLKEAHDDRRQRDSVIIHQISWTLKLATTRLMRGMCQRWSVAVGQRVHFRSSHWKMVLRREKRTLGKGLDGFAITMRAAHAIEAAVQRSMQCRSEVKIAEILEEWIGECQRRHRTLQAHTRGLYAQANFTHAVVQECVRRWQQACALRNKHGAGLDGNTAAGVAFVRCIMGASEDPARTIPEWAVRRLCGLCVCVCVCVCFSLPLSISVCGYVFACV